MNSNDPYLAVHSNMRAVLLVDYVLCAESTAGLIMDEPITSVPLLDSAWHIVMRPFLSGTLIVQ
jgi:hypothetical protein